LPCELRGLAELNRVSLAHPQSASAKSPLNTALVSSPAPAVVGLRSSHFHLVINCCLYCRSRIARGMATGVVPPTCWRLLIGSARSAAHFLLAGRPLAQHAVELEEIRGAGAGVLAG